MATYVSALTGAQMDDALTQLNNRVAEGWAVGQKDGTDVGSTSLYYENNAKYYAEQAAESATDLDTAVDAAEAAQAAAESAAAQAQSIQEGQALVYNYDLSVQLIKAESIKDNHWVITLEEAS